MYPNNYGSPYPPPQPAGSFTNSNLPTQTGPARTRNNGRNTASRSYVKGVETSVKDTNLRLDDLISRVDYMESFLMRSFGPNYEAYAVFKARETLSNTMSDCHAAWQLPNRPLEVSQAIQPPSTPRDLARGDMTPCSSKVQSEPLPGLPDSHHTLIKELRSLKELFKQGSEKEHSSKEAKEGAEASQDGVWRLAKQCPHIIFIRILALPSRALNDDAPPSRDSPPRKRPTRPRLSALRRVLKKHTKPPVHSMQSIKQSGRSNLHGLL